MEKACESECRGAIVTFWYDPATLEIVKCSASGFKETTIGYAKVSSEASTWSKDWTADGEEPVAGIFFKSALLDGVVFEIAFA